MATLSDNKQDWQWLKDEIKRRAPGWGIDKIGFASADPFTEMKQILLNHRQKGHESGFEEPDIEKRIDPALSLPEARSIIAIAVAYPSKMKDAPRSKPGAYRGIFSRSSWGRDYHEVLRERLGKVEAFLHEHVEGVRLKSMVDTGALVDRAVAVRAGIGWSGKNCAVITPEFGSWVYLGEMITNIPFPPDVPITEDCGECTICLDRCPTGALVGPGQLNASLCISFATQKKGIIDDEMKRKIGNRLYGCDTCQIVCPKNKGINSDHHEEFKPDPERAKPLLLPLLKLSNREFKQRYGHKSGAWRGKNPIQRNAVIALGHFRDRSALPELKRILLEDPRPALREAAAWALGRIGGDEALGALDKALQHEEDAEVRAAIEKGKKVCMQETEVVK